MNSDLFSWNRYGRGQSYRFYATDEEVQDILLRCLPVEFAPYLLIGYDTVRKGRIYEQQIWTAEISDYIALRNEGKWDFYIRSNVLTPELPSRGGNHLSHLLPTIGCINLQACHYIHSSYFEPAVLGIIDKVRNTASGDVAVHEDYLSVYKLVKKAIKSIMAYTTLQPSSDGPCESKSILISDGIMRKVQLGEITGVTPVHKI